MCEQQFFRHLDVASNEQNDLSDVELLTLSGVEHWRKQALILIILDKSEGLARQHKLHERNSGPSAASCLLELAMSQWNIGFVTDPYSSSR